MVLVVAGFAIRTQGLHQFLAVVAELVDRVGEVVDDPDVLLRIVGIHVHGMRLHEHRVPLAPGLHDVAFPVDDDQAVLPACVDAASVARPFPGHPAIFVVVIRTRRRSVSPGQCSVAPGILSSDREAQERSLLVKQAVFRSVDFLQNAALKYEDPVGALGENSLRRAPGPVFMARKRGEVLWPARNGFVRSKGVLAALARNDGCLGGNCQCDSLGQRKHSQIDDGLTYGCNCDRTIHFKAHSLTVRYKRRLAD